MPQPTSVRTTPSRVITPSTNPSSIVATLVSVAGTVTVAPRMSVTRRAAAPAAAPLPAESGG